MTRYLQVCVYSKGQGQHFHTADNGRLTMTQLYNMSQLFTLYFTSFRIHNRNEKWISNQYYDIIDIASVALLLPSSLCIFAFTDIIVSKGDTRSSKNVPVKVSMYNSISLFFMTIIHH